MCTAFEEPDMVLHTVIAVFTVTLVRFGRCIIVLSLQASDLYLELVSRNPNTDKAAVTTYCTGSRQLLLLTVLALTHA